MVYLIAGAGNKMGSKTGEVRPVNRGDFYLSNDIPMGFEAHEDSTAVYEILELVEDRRKA
jgi:hypothetical protein